MFCGELQTRTFLRKETTLDTSVVFFMASVRVLVQLPLALSLSKRFFEACDANTSDRLEESELAVFFSNQLQAANAVGLSLDYGRVVSILLWALWTILLRATTPHLHCRCSLFADALCIA